MRIAVDAMLLGGTHSGVEAAIEGLCLGLREAGGGHEFLVAHRPAYDAGDLRGGPVTAFRAPAWTGPRAGRIVWERAVLPRRARRWGAQVLHAPGYILPSGWRGPAVLTVYDILALTHPEWCKWSNAVHYRRALPRSIARADLVAVPSEFVRGEVLERLGVAPEKVRVVPLGVSPQMTPAPPEAVAAVRSQLDLPQRYLLWVGNIEPKKNLEGMVRAFELAAPDIPHDFVIAGRAAWKAGPSLEALARSPVSERLRRLGYVPASMLPALYTGADLLVQWSLYEGAGLTPLEAMACGTPAVVSDGGALPEVAGQAAPVVPLGDPAALAAEVVSLLTESGRLERLRAGTRGWAAQFTWPAHARRMVALYEEAVGLATRA